MKKPHSLARGVAEGRGELSAYPRIAVIGCPGSGKSTLARQIAAHTGHPLIHLDYERWQPGWIAIPNEEFVAKQKQWVQGERWIIDGNYIGTQEIRFAAADLVIFLDLPALLCLRRAIKRRGTQRPDMRPGVIEQGFIKKDFTDFFIFILFYRWQRRPKTLALHKKYPETEFLRLRTRRAVRELIRTL